MWQQRQSLAVAARAGNAVNWRQIAGLESRCGSSAGADRYPQGSLPHHPPTRLSQFHGGLVVRGEVEEEQREGPLSTTDTGTNEAPSLTLKMKEAGSEVDSLGARNPLRAKNEVMHRGSHHVCVCVCVCLVLCNY